MRLLDPTLDVVFKMLMLADERLLRSMIEAVFGLTEPLAALTVLNPELPSHFPEDHGVVLDVRVRLASGEEVDLEMATRAGAELPPRLLFYWARHFSTTLPKGEDYRRLVPLRFIVWTQRSILPAVTRFHEVFDVVGRHSGARFAPHFELHLLDLSRSPVVGVEEPRLVRWARFFSLDSRLQANLLAKEDPIMSLAVKKLEDLSNDPTARRIAADRERDIAAHGHNLASARHFGREEGIAEGLELGRREGQAALVAAIETMSEVLGVTLTDERRRELQRCSPSALVDYMNALRRGQTALPLRAGRSRGCIGRRPPRGGDECGCIGPLLPCGGGARGCIGRLLPCGGGACRCIGRLLPCGGGACRCIGRLPPPGGGARSCIGRPLPWGGGACSCIGRLPRSGGGGRSCTGGSRGGEVARAAGSGTSGPREGADAPETAGFLRVVRANLPVLAGLWGRNAVNGV